MESKKLSAQTLEKQYPGHGLVSVVFAIEPTNSNLNFTFQPNTHVAIAFKENPDLAFFKAVVKLIRSLPQEISFTVINHKKYNQTNASLISMPKDVEDLIDTFHQKYGDKLPGMPDKREHHFAGIAPIGSKFKATGIKIRIIENNEVKPWILVDFLLNWTLILKEAKKKGVNL